MNIGKAIAIGVFLVFAAIYPTGAIGCEPGAVDSVLSHYLVIQTALANDDLGQAQSGAEQLDKVIERAGSELPDNLGKSARSIRGASSMDSARQSFQNLSDQVIRLAKEKGFRGKKPLFVAHCPMAFNGEGGTWVQADKTITNPYYGSAMLRCGSVRGPLSGDTHKAPGSKAADSHNHSSH